MAPPPPVKQLLIFRLRYNAELVIIQVHGYRPISTTPEPLGPVPRATMVQPPQANQPHTLLLRWRVIRAMPPLLGNLQASIIRSSVQTAQAVTMAAALSAKR